jgi:thioredoxin-dependent peroxiredoxin
MPLLLGSTAPNFSQKSSVGPLDLYDYIEDFWCVLFSHPKDFTPVCTTELGTVSKYLPEFEKRNVRVLVVSVDDEEAHQRWIEDINETQNTSLSYPIIADEDKKVSHLYHMIHPKADNTLTVRSVFVIDPNKKIRLTLTYPASTGRNFEEILRVIDSLQLTDNYQVATPANWVDGKEVVIIPTVSKEEALEKFPKGVVEIKPYLRLTPQPNR